MAALSPRFALTVGPLRSDAEHPAASPSYFEVERSLDVPADGFRVRLSERAGIVPGDAVELDLGDGDEVIRVFTGTVAEVRPQAAGTEVFAVGTMLSLLELRASELYQDQSAGDVARDLIGKAGLDAGDISDGIGLPRFAVHRRQGAYFQLKALADRLGYSLFSDREGKIHFRGLGPAAGLDALGGALGSLGGSAAGLLQGGGDGPLSFGRHLLASRATLRQPIGRKLVVGGESPMSGQGEDKSFWLTAKDADFQDSQGDGEEWLVLDPLARTKDMAGRFAAGYLEGMKRRTGEIRITIPGRAGLELGDSISTADAADDALNAGGFVKALRHRLGRGTGFVTEVALSVEGGP